MESIYSIADIIFQKNNTRYFEVNLHYGKVLFSKYIHS